MTNSCRPVYATTLQFIQLHQDRAMKKVDHCLLPKKKWIIVTKINKTIIILIIPILDSSEFDSIISIRIVSSSYNNLSF